MHIYAGSPQEILGSMRMRIWRPGTVPKPMWDDIEHIGSPWYLALRVPPD